MHEPLLRAREVRKYFPIRRGLLRRSAAHVRAVERIDLDIGAGETLGLVGESGSGKSTLGRILAGLMQPSAGTVWFDGAPILDLQGAELRRARRQLQFIFQDPSGALDPRMRVRDIVGEGLDAEGVERGARDRRIAEMLDRVGLRPEAAHRYPHELSGGQRQRVGIARALVLRPKLVVADEPVSALDVSIQSQVLNLLVELKRELRLTYVFVSHNLAAVSYVSDRIAVMYLGALVELTSTERLCRTPLHPYTQALLSAVPEPYPGRGRQTVLLRGDIPNPIEPPSGCRFRTRCPLARSVCAEQEPQLAPKSGGTEAHLVACHLA
jgi:peptide/nickel transport system ATP-binding protein/oligopeptide transport system ATP-binding protein